MLEYAQLILLNIMDPRWMDFIHCCNDANIFHHPAWLHLMCQCYGYSPFILTIIDKKDQIQAGLPFIKINNFIAGYRWVSLSFSDYCNPLYRDPTALVALRDQLIQASESNQVGKIEVRWQLPEHPNVQLNSDFVLHTIQLDSNPERVAKRFKRTHLQNIRTAEQRGVTVEFGDQLEHLRIFYSLQLETRRRHGVPSQSWNYFNLLWQNIINAGLGFVLLAKKDREYIAGMVYLSWGKTLVAKYAASKEDSFNLRPNNLLFWEGICWGCQNGFQIFDMGRTEIDNTGLRNFKNRWGAVEVPLYYSTISCQPHRKTARDKLVKVVKSAIQRAPLWVCRLSGELLYRYFG